MPKNINISRISHAYQHISTVNKLLVNVAMTDTSAIIDEDLIISAVTQFAEQLQQADTTKKYLKKIEYKVEPEQILAVSQFVIENMPYFLTAADYKRLDTLLTEEYISRQMLMSPIGMAVKQNINADPLHF